MMKTPALDKYLAGGHKDSCTMHRYSDRENRKCSCGYDKALQELAELKKLHEIQIQFIPLEPETV